MYRMRLFRTMIAVFFCGYLLSCGPVTSDPSKFPMLVTSQNAQFNGQLMAVEGGLKVGLNRYQMSLTSLVDTESPVESITVEPWMPDHGHGSDRSPEVSRTEQDLYLIENVVYTMPGFWELRVEVMTQSGADTLVFELDVQ